MSKLDKTEVLSAFEAAYEAAHGKKPEITTKPGWYSIDGGKNMRLADVAALTEELTSGSAAPSQEAAPAKKEAKKPAAPAKTKKAAFLRNSQIDAALCCSGRERFRMAMV